MAKKVKTPEEVKAAMEKKVAKRTLFFGTFRKALAFFLAIAFTFAMVQIAFTSKTGGVVASLSGTASSDSGSSNDNGTGDDNLVDFGGGDNGNENNDGNGSTNDNNGGNTGNENNGGNGGAATTAMSKAEGAEALNKATAEAAKAGYDWSRKCYYTDDGALAVKMSNGKDATETLDGVIHRVAEDASLGSVVGGFLDITGKDDAKTAKKAKGSSAAPEGMKDKFLLKATALTEGDLSQFVKQGDTYKYQVKTCNNPQKDNNNALHHATNDFTTKDEVAQQVAEGLGSLSSLVKISSAEIQYNSIVIVAEIKDGKLQSLSLNYTMDVKSLNLTALATVKIVGTGKANVEANYTNFVY